MSGHCHSHEHEHEHEHEHDHDHHDHHDHENMCGMGMMHHHYVPFYRLIFWALLFSAVFAAGYIIGEVKARVLDGAWGRMRVYSQHMMPEERMMAPGRMMIQKDGDNSDVMIYGGEDGERMTGPGDVMIMVSGTKR